MFRLAAKNLKAGLRFDYLEKQHALSLKSLEALLAGELRVLNFPKKIGHEQWLSLDKWSVTSDGDFGGPSRAKLALLLDNPIRARFEGYLSHQAVEEQPDLATGFCACVSPSLAPLEFESYPREAVALAVRCRIPEGFEPRVFSLTVRCAHFMESEIYHHGIMNIQDHEWGEYIIPLHRFTGTKRGFVRKDYQIDMQKLSAVGFQAWGDEGDFALEVEGITAAGLDMLSDEEALITQDYTP